ncbi:hypothetical protein FIBSPDRAFT_411830 [Athelia psychrophila]|uniref:DUF6534 domain-containing protein n=1 Tax=Athelia psychrophila TaxID=1759441 RepID=A0A166NCJ0_9AGAM|nr:hypothetical protein FIBSPDRAFT_411830 [Fibularhizoctonia sp. CBS 109695]
MPASVLPQSDVCGLLLIACFLSLILFGVILAQALTYCRNCEGDDPRMKLFVGILVTLDVANSAAGMAWIYQMLVNGWGNSAAFESDPLPFGMILTLPPIRCLSHFFFARRLHILSGKRCITLIIAFSSMLGFCGGIGTGIATVWIKDFSQFGKFQVVGIVGVVITAVCPVVADLTITVGMTYHLRRSKGNFEATDRLLDRVIQLTLQNCALTSSYEIVSLSLYYAFDKPYFFAVFFLAPMFYLHCVLSSLNARKTLRALANATVDLGGQSLLRSASAAGGV